MNKLLSTTLTLTLLAGTCSAYAGSAITVPVPTRNQIAANSEMELPLDVLSKEVPYLISCHLDSTSPTTLDMKFSTRLAPNGGFGVDKLNDKPILQNLGTLQRGDNTYSFMVSISANSANNKSTQNVLVLKNLDDQFSATLKNCEARPASNVTNAANKVSGGFFYVKNNLPYYLDIAVGNYIPTKYCIRPYQSQFVAVSTNNQNIEIIGTHY